MFNKQIVLFVLFYGVWMVFLLFFLGGGEMMYCESDMEPKLLGGAL